jgi:hypothetical protein
VAIEKENPTVVELFFAERVVLGSGEDGQASQRDGDAGDDEAERMGRHI